MPEAVWVAELRVSENTRRKISAKHGAQLRDVRAAVVGVRGLVGTWNEDPNRGRRLMLRGRIKGRRWVLVLYPVEHPMGDVWSLASIYEDEN